MLTQRTVDRTTKPGRYRDELTPGLYLTVSANGARSWIFRYELRGHERMMGLGSASAFNLKEARERARAARQLLIDGIDPLERKRAAEASAASRMTFAEAMQKFVEQHESKWKLVHRNQVVNSLTAYALPVIGDLNVADITTPDVLRVVEPIWKAKTETADRVRNRIESILAWATVRGYRKGDNPAKWAKFLDQVLPSKSEIAPTKHHSAMPYSELPGFMQALRAAEGIGTRALEFAILNASRTDEVIGAVWSEIDLDAKIWIIPGERMKAGKEHRVPLSQAALDLLASLPREDGNPHVFIGRKAGTAMSDMGLNRALRSLRDDRCVVHGFRSTFKDWASEQTAYPTDVVEMALAHFVGNKVEQAYRRGDMLEKRTRLMRDWARYCLMPVAEGGKKVAPIRG